MPLVSSPGKPWFASAQDEERGECRCAISGMSMPYIWFCSKMAVGILASACDTRNLFQGSVKCLSLSPTTMPTGVSFGEALGTGFRTYRHSQASLHRHMLFIFFDTTRTYASHGMSRLSRRRTNSYGRVHEKYILYICTCCLPATIRKEVAWIRDRSTSVF